MTADTTVRSHRPALLASWAGRLLRSGVPRHEVVRAPLDAVRAGAGVVVAVLAWWGIAERGGTGWSLGWEWLEITLVVLAGFGLAGTGLVVTVVAILQRRWPLALVAALSVVAATTLLLGAVHGSVPAATVGWGAAVATSTALWPAALSTLRRSLLGGELLALVLVLVCTTTSVAAVVAATGLGYAAGCLWRLAVGRDVAGVSPAETAALLAELGVQVEAVERAPSGRHGVAARFLSRTPSGTVETWIYQRSTVDTQLLARLLRFFWFRNARMPVPLTRMQHIEHHVALVLRAAGTGATSTTVVASGLAGPAEDAVVVTTWDDAPCLAELAAEQVGPGELDTLWQCARSMANAGIAHGHLDAAAVALRDGRWYVRDLPAGALAALPADLAADRAALLVATTRLVGREAALAAASRALSQAELAAVLPLLQNAALPPTLRAPRKSTELVELRAAVAKNADVADVELASVHRVKASSVLMAAGTLLGLWLLIGEFSGFTDLWSTLLSANWWWIAAAFVVGVIPNFTEAIALSGAVASPLRIAPLVVLRLADGFFGLVGGTVATTAAAVRYFQKEGLGASIAVSSGVLYSLAGFAVQVVVSATCLVFAWDSFSLANAQSTEGSSGGSSGGHDLLLILLAVLIVAGVVAGLVVLRPRWRRQVVDRARPQVALIRGNLHDIAAQPGKLGRLFGANLGSQVLFAAALGLSLRAYGGSASIAVLLLVNTAASLLGGLAPIPGGMGVMEGAIITGLLAAGVPESQAIPATFAYRMITAYLPPVWGWPATLWLRRHDYL